MNSITWLLLAILWVAICIEFTLWLCPRLFRFVPKDGE